eukprot:4397020-Lingulodinium_polyedra.AAC.1
MVARSGTTRTGKVDVASGNNGYALVLSGARARVCPKHCSPETRSRSCPAQSRLPFALEPPSRSTGR